MIRLLARLARDIRGVTATEFALILPILMLLSIGTFETSRLIMLNQKLQNGTFILADLVARDRTIDEESLGNIFLALGSLIEPFEFDDNGTAILSSIGAAADDDPRLNWQRRGAGSLDAASSFGSEPGEPVPLPETLTLDADETLIAAEVFFSYEPFFGLTARQHILRKVSFHKPRLGTLETVQP